MSWKKMYLKEVCNEIFAGGDVPKGRVSKELTDQYQIPIYSNGATNDGLYGYTDFARVTEPCVTVSARGTIGYSVLRTEPFLPVVRLIVLIPNPEIINISFLHYVARSIAFGNSGASIPQLTVPMIKEYEIKVPTLAEQQDIVDKLDEGFRDTSIVRANFLNNLENLKELEYTMLMKSLYPED